MSCCSSSVLLPVGARRKVSFLSRPWEHSQIAAWLGLNRYLRVGVVTWRFVTCWFRVLLQETSAVRGHIVSAYLCIWCDFDRASSLIFGNKMPTRCNRGFYCRSSCLLNMFRASLCPSSGAQEYYTVVAASGISCCGFSSSWSGVELRVMCSGLQDAAASCKPDT